MNAQIYDELKRMASALMRGERASHTLQATALVHEAFVRLADHAKANGLNEIQFRAAAATAMRRILVDHAREKGADKRGGRWARITLSEAVDEGIGSEIDLLDLHTAMEELAAASPRRAQVVEARFFGGMSSAEVGELLGIATKTADADWYFARAWLQRRLAGAAG